MNSHEQAVASPNARSTNRGMDDGTQAFMWVPASQRVMRVTLGTHLDKFGWFWCMLAFLVHSHLHHRMRNKQWSRKDLGPFRLLVLVCEPIICLLWNLQEALLADTFLTNYVFQYLRFFVGSSASWHIWQTVYFQPIPEKLIIQRNMDGKWIVFFEYVDK